MTLYEEQEAEIGRLTARLLRLRTALAAYADRANWAPRQRPEQPQPADVWYGPGHGYDLAERVLASERE